MAHLLALPEEILIEIIKKLDLKSIYNLYNTCNRTRRIICMFGVVKCCNMSLNTMASAHILKLRFFKDISPFIQELNMCGVQNLNKTLLKPAMKRLKCLKCLNVGYTIININDLLNIYQSCPTITKVTINFIFEKKRLNNLDIGDDILVKCQEMFENFKNVHFIGSQSNLIYNKIVPFILQRARNINLQYTISSVEESVYRSLYQNVNEIFFDKLYIYLKNTSLYDTVFPINTDKCECVVITMLHSLNTIVHCTPLFTEFFKTNFAVNPRLMSEYNHIFVHNAILLFWNKETIDFNKSFFQMLNADLQRYFVYLFDSSKKESAPLKYDRFHTTYNDPPSENVDNYDMYESAFKRSRLGLSNVVINYDDVFKEKKDIYLSIYFNSVKRSSITLSSDSNFLSKIKYLCLKGVSQYSGEFFNILFRCCTKLETFNYEDPVVPSIKSIVRSIPLSKSIKNIRLISKSIDFKTVISFLSQCSTLENIHLIDLWKDGFEINDYQIIFQKCTHLYCLHLYGLVSDNIKNKQLLNLNRAKLMFTKPHISVKVISDGILDDEQYCPYTDIFNVNVIKPIEIYFCC